MMRFGSLLRFGVWRRGSKFAHRARADFRRANAETAAPAAIRRTRSWRARGGELDARGAETAELRDAFADGWRDSRTP